MKFLSMPLGVIAGIVVLGSTLTPAASAQARPALTQDVDNPGRNTFLLRQDLYVGRSATFTVPAGKRYVIEQYTADCSTPDSDTLIDVELIAVSNLMVGMFHAPAHYSYSPSTLSYARYAGTGLGPIYADPGTDITIYANRGSSKENE